MEIVWHAHPPIREKAAEGWGRHHWRERVREEYIGSNGEQKAFQSSLTKSFSIMTTEERPVGAY